MTWLLISIGVVVAGLTGLLMAPEGPLDLVLLIGFVVIPLFMAPWAAWSICRDRETGLAEVQAVAGLDLYRVLGAKLVTLSMVVVCLLLTAVPLLWGLTTAATTGGLATAAPYLAWGLACGVIASVLGLVVGLFWKRSTPEAVATAFAAVVGWIMLAWFGPQLVGSAGSGVAAKGFRALVHTSPITWALDWFQGATPTFVSLQGLIGGPLYLLACSLVLLAAFPAGLQTLLGPDRGTRARRLGTILLLAGVVVLGAGLVAWPHQPPDETPHGNAPTGPGAQVSEVDISPKDGGHRFQAASSPVVATLALDGPPNTTVVLSSVHVTSPTSDIEITTPLPIEAHLDPEGQASVDLEATLSFADLREEHVLTTAWTLDGDKRETQVTVVLSAWPMDRGHIFLGALLGVGSTATVGTIAAVRRNVW